MRRAMSPVAALQCSVLAIKTQMKTENRVTRHPLAARMARIIASVSAERIGLESVFVVNLFIFCQVAILAACGQSAPQSDPSLARILQEQRFNAGAGKFGSAFAQEDGVVYREESVGNNERVGQYSYIGDDGKTYTVKYSAGVNGFRSVLA